MSISFVVELIIGRGKGIDSSFKIFTGHFSLDSILGSYSVPGMYFSTHNPS
jgi:hypothetical protein